MDIMDGQQWTTVIIVMNVMQSPFDGKGKLLYRATGRYHAGSHTSHEAYVTHSSEIAGTCRYNST